VSYPEDCLTSRCQSRKNQLSCLNSVVWKPDELGTFALTVSKQRLSDIFRAKCPADVTGIDSVWVTRVPKESLGRSVKCSSWFGVI